MLPRPVNPQPQPSPPPEMEIEVNYFTVLIEKIGEGNGLVKSEPGGIYCGEVCSYDYPGGITIKLSVEPDKDSKFMGWGGDCSECGLNETCYLFVDSQKTCEAHFALNEPPQIIDFSAYPLSGQAPLYTIFTWVIEDAENDEITCRFDINSDGNFEYVIPYCLYQSYQDHTFEVPGNYKVVFQVEDAVGNVSTKEVTIKVDVPPQVYQNGDGGGCSTYGDISAAILIASSFLFIKAIFSIFKSSKFR